ncbi:hypothetical protein OG943_04095 [Amycolatopsis sp. NBC_00345]|uniref:hypothetical protein n=1 Tax=Amycolatopsis sp. NBC_00345 TaxID=2975955 RepID=UPI002E2572A2
MAGDQDRRIRDAERELDEISHHISEAKAAAKEALPDEQEETPPAEGAAPSQS